MYFDLTIRLITTLFLLVIILSIVFIMKKIVFELGTRDKQIRKEIEQKGYEARGNVVTINLMEMPSEVFDTIFASDRVSIQPLRTGIYVQVDTIVDGFMDVCCIRDEKEYQIGDEVIIRYLKYDNGYRGIVIRKL